jgi:Tol biopolymer transport system component/TolA-binding protein
MHAWKPLRSPLIVLVAVLLLSSLSPMGRAAAQEGQSLPGQFAYVESGTRLYLVRGDVSRPILLVEAGGDRSVYNPRFSHDGRYLAFCLTSPSEADLPGIFYLDTLTLEKSLATADGSCSYNWSPDGKTLIYSTPPAMEYPSTHADGIWAYQRESGESKLLLATDTTVIDPRWSPDGHTISYFDFCFECVGQFYTYDLNTGDTQAWSHEGTGDYIGPDVDWSPDGLTLAYDKELWMYAPPGKTYGLYLSDPDGGRRQEIYSQLGRGAYFPIWSPDGKRIAFVSFESFVIGNYMNVRGDLMTASPDGSNARKLYSSVYQLFPQAWSPDGRYLLFIEPASMPQDSVQKQQLVLLDAEAGSLLWKQSSEGSIAADWAPVPAGKESSRQEPAQLAGHPGLLYVSPDYALAFYEPVSGRVQKLTPSFSGQDFSLSPDGRTILFGNQIVSVQGQADGSISASLTAATPPKDFSTLKWSPDGKDYGYVEDDVIWQADLSGNRWMLTEGDSPPDWSYDGRWMAFCDREGRLWIGETGKPADWIIQQDHCQVSWSPGQSILAYASFPSRDFIDQATGTAFLYDPISGSTNEVAQKVSEVGWSPDGKLVSIKRVTWMGASNYGFSLSAVNPESGQELLIEEFNAEMYGNHGWIRQTDGYLVGKYKFQADLLNKEQLADILFDASPDGNRLLVGSGNEQSLQVICREVETNADHKIAKVTLKDLPGVYASFSPDGKDVLVSNDEMGQFTDWIASCSRLEPVQFSTLALPDQQYFSPGGSWLVTEETDARGEQKAKVTLRELESGHVTEIPAGLQTRSAWFQMPEAPLAASSAAPVDVTAAAGWSPAAVTTPAPLQAHGLRKRVVMFSLLVWAGALIIIVVLMLYLWKRWSAPGQPAKTADEQKSSPTAETVSQPSPEELEKAFQEGVSLVRAGQAAEGIAALSKVIRAQPGNDGAWFWLGIASARQRDLRSAERCFLQARRHGHPEANNALEWLRKQRL